MGQWSVGLCSVCRVGWWGLGCESCEGGGEGGGVSERTSMSVLGKLGSCVLGWRDGGGTLVKGVIIWGL